MIVLAFIATMFSVDNAEFFNQVEKNKQDGMSWHYVGSTAPDANDPSIASINPITGKEAVFFKMSK
jgi:hypothetical protein